MRNFYVYNTEFFIKSFWEIFGVVFETYHAYELIRCLNKLNLKIPIRFYRFFGNYLYVDNFWA